MTTELNEPAEGSRISHQSAFQFVKKQLYFLFGFVQPVRRDQFIKAGLGLLLLKYAVEAGLAWMIADTFYSPLQFLNPVLMSRIVSLGAISEWVAILWLCWTFLFIWPAVALCIRRSVDSGGSPWAGLFILVPGLNLPVLLWLAFAPSRNTSQPVASSEDSYALSAISAALLGIVSGALLTLILTIVIASTFNRYGEVLFIGCPLLIATISSMILNLIHPRSYMASILQGGITIILAGAVLLVCAVEGAICLLMAAPLELPLALLGGAIGKFIVSTSRRPIQGSSMMLLLLPAWAGVETVTHTPREFLVTTTIEIDAPIDTVWETFINFPEIPPPKDWLFRTGIAYPVSAEIDGEGVGAIRSCNFSTGKFVEPITTWDAPSLLAFDVREQPHPMFELSPYRHIHPPHLDGMLRSNRGEIRLETLPGGQTRLTGNTWYEFHIHPQEYWTIWSQYIIHRIHLRVLNHVKTVAESKTVNSH